MKKYELKASSQDGKIIFNKGTDIKKIIREFYSLYQYEIETQEETFLCKIRDLTTCKNIHTFII